MSGKAYDLFVSYADADREWVEGFLLDALNAAGTRILTQKDFPLGSRWTKQFERAVEQSARVLLVVSSAYLGDLNQQFVDGLSAYRSLQADEASVIVLLLEDVPLRLGLEALVKLRAITSADREAAITRLCKDLNVESAAARPIPCPYPGMRSFRLSDKEQFFGRRSECETIIHRLNLQPCIFLIGSSGSGKSSLAMAGVLPALPESQLFGTVSWQHDIVRPGERSGKDPTLAMSQLGTDFVEAVDAMEKTVRASLKCVVIVDQYEEAFSQLTPVERDGFESQLLKWVDEDAGARYVVVTARADFYSDLMLSPVWRRFGGNHFDVLPLDRDNLREAIVEPALKCGVFVERTLVDHLLNDAIGEPGALSLLQETMRLIWEKLERRFLPHTSYRSLTQCAGRTALQAALAAVADTALSKLSPRQREIAMRIFLRLVQFGQGRPDTRRQQRTSRLRSQTDAKSSFEDTLQHLVDSRLLVLCEAKTAESSAPRDPLVDLAHEQLIVSWPEFQRWLAARREAEVVRRRLEDKATEWVRLGSGDGGLLDEIELREAQGWSDDARNTELGTSVSLEQLLAASKRKIAAGEEAAEDARKERLFTLQKLAETETQRAEAEARKKRGFLWATIVSLSLFGVAVVAGILAVQQNKAALRNAQTARANAIVQAADRMRDPAAAALMLRSLGTATEPNDGVGAAQRIIARGIPTHELRVHRDWVTSVAFHPNGQDVVSSSHDQSARVSRLDSGDSQELRHQHRVERVAILPSGTELLTFTADGFIHFWKWDEWNAPRSSVRAFEPKAGGVFEFQIVEVPARLVVVSEFGEAVVLDLNATPPKPIYRSGTKARPIVLMETSKDNMMAVAVREDGALELHPLVEPHGEQHLGQATAPVVSATLSTDRSYVAIASNERIEVWSLVDKERVAVWEEKGASFRDVQFDKTGKHLFVGSADIRSIRCWSLDSKSVTFVLEGYEPDPSPATNFKMFGSMHSPWMLRRRSLVKARLSPDREQIVTLPGDLTARLWNSATGKVGSTFRAGDGAFLDVAWNDNQSRFAAGSIDGTIRIWKTGPPLEPQVILPTGGRDVKSITFDPTGTRMLAPFRSGGGKLIELNSAGTARLIGDPVGPDGLGTTGIRITSTVTTKGAFILIRDKDSLLLCRDGVNQGDAVRVDLNQKVSCAEFSPDGSLLALGCENGDVMTYAVQDGAVTPLTHLSGRIVALSFDAKGRRILTVAQSQSPGARATTARLLELRGGHSMEHVIAGAPAKAATEDERRGTVVQFVADSAKLVTFDGDKVQLWTIGLSHVVSTELGQQSRASGIRCAALSRDGRWVATATGNEVILWKGDGTGVARRLTDHRSRVTSLRFDLSSSRLLTASWDKTARLWAVANEGRPIVLEGHAAGLSDANFNFDESRIVTAASDGSVRAWRYRWSDVVEYLTTATKATLKTEQRAMLLGEAGDEEH